MDEVKDLDIDVKKIKDIVLNEVNSLQQFDLQYKEPERILEPYEKHRFNCTFSWFNRCSWFTKVNILKGLAMNVTNLHTLINIINTIYTATSKDWIYSTYQGMQRYPCDTVIADDYNNRACEPCVLQDVVIEFLKWYKTLEDHDQYAMMMDMIRLADSCVFGKIFTEFIKILKCRFRTQELEASAIETRSTITDSEKSEKKTKKENKEKKRKKDKRSKEEIEREKQLLLEQQELEMQKQRELDAIYSFLNEKLPDNSLDPLTIELNKLLGQWDSFMASYKKQLGIGVPPKKKKEKKEKENKKGKKKKKEKVNKNIPDQIQLLPIWINKPIVASDPKILNGAKKVNKYWKFLAKGIKQDVKCRNEINKISQKLKKNLPQMEDVKKLHVDNKLHSKYTNISYTTDPSILKKFVYNGLTTSTLVSDLYKRHAATHVAGTILDSFPRRILL